MQHILVQRSHDIRFASTLALLDSEFDTLAVADTELARTIERNQHAIDGFVFFHLTSAASRAAEILTDERFNKPSMPIAYLGHLARGAHLPFGTISFGQSQTEDLLSHLRNPQPLSVLVVEDDDGIREVLELCLSTHYEITCAADGHQALQVLESRSFELVILDVMLPGISGDEVFTYIQNHCPDTAVIVITAYDNKQREFGFAFRGADAYIPKPFESNTAFRRLVMQTIKARHEKRASHAQTERLDKENLAWRQYADRMRSYV